MTVDELFKILIDDKPSVLIKHNEEEIFKMVPELKVCKGFNQNNVWHIYDVYEHILHVIDETECDLSLRICALFHDLGKPFTYQQDKNGVGHFPFHWVKSVKIFEEFVKKYNLEGKLNVDEIRNLIYFHDINIRKLEGSRKEEFDKVFNNENMVKKLFNIKRADLKSQNPIYHHYLEDYKIDEENMLKSIYLEGYMSKEEKVINYYILCNKLKNVIRTGWLNWNVKRERIESVAEHIYGVQMLALAMKSEYQYNIDIMKVIYMLAVHELGEILIGDLTQFEISKEDKEKKEHDAIHEILSPLIDGDKIESLCLEFDERKTPEAKFAYQCDKLECDIQSKLYDQEGCVDLTKQEGNDTVNNKLVKELLESGKSWSDMWIEYGQRVYPYDENFMSVSNYIKNNNIEDEFDE